MSKTKFLGIPEGGKRAGWIEMEGGSSAGVGGGVFWIAAANDGAGGHTIDKTFEEIKAAYESGKDLKVILNASSGATVGLYVLNFSQYMGIPGTIEAFSFLVSSIVSDTSGHMLMLSISDTNELEFKQKKFSFLTE